MSSRALALLAGLLICTNVPAVTIAVGDLPAEIQACRTAGTCIVPLSSSIDIPNLSGSAAHDGTVAPFAANVFQIIDGGTPGYLLRYNLVQPSAALVGDTVQPLGGSVWLHVDAQYAPDMFTPTAQLYLDRVSPSPPNLLPGHADGLALDISLSAAALSGATGTQAVSCCTDTTYTGTMSIAGSFGGEALLPCLAYGCYAAARLDFLYLLFSDLDGDGVFQTSINPLDSRGRLFTVQNYDPYGGLEGTGSSSSVSYYVSTVPLPPALYLFGAGVLLLTARLRPRSAF